MQNRQSLRKHLRQQRRNLSQTQQLRAARKTFWLLARHPWLRKAKHIALYIAADGELNPSPLINWARSLHKHLYLPCVARDRAHMEFKRWPNGGRLRRNRYGIPEPTHPQTVELAKLDVILMPLVGFDAAGNRLGMGGGYYDRTLAKLPQHTRLLGLAHKIQQIPAVPVAAWDVPLHAIFTDAGTVYPRRASNTVHLNIEN